VILEQTKYCLEKKKTNRENQEVLETPEEMPNGKLIVTMQICFTCGKEFPFKRGRKSCPCCQGLLRTKTMILKTP
jgi:hypothetical protein